MIRTGDHFTAVDRCNEINEYVFLGIKMFDHPFISLYNCTTQSTIEVGLSWFDYDASGRTIKN